MYLDDGKVAFVRGIQDGAPLRPDTSEWLSSKSPSRRKVSFMTVIMSPFTSAADA